MRKKEPEINLHLGCSLQAMREMKDNQYDLAIVDPPYGIKRSGQKEYICKKGRSSKKYFEHKNWDRSIPSKEYFNHLFRISKEQIIWGGNYFTQYLPGKMGWIVWDNGQYNLGMSDGELAFTSFQKALRIWKKNRAVFLSEGGTIHPTQKPIELYKWLLENYANEGDKILDTHLGSGSIACACYDLGFDLDAWEIDKDYYRDTLVRYNNYSKQIKLF